MPVYLRLITQTTDDEDRGKETRRRKSEKEEDAELMQDADNKEGGEEEGEDAPFNFTESPSCASASSDLNVLPDRLAQMLKAARCETIRSKVSTG